MVKCKICGKPLSEKGIKKGRTEHYGCRMFRITKKKSVNVIQLDSTDFNEACRAIDKNPDLMEKLFIN